MICLLFAEFDLHQVLVRNSTILHPSLVRSSPGIWLTVRLSDVDGKWGY